MDRRRGDLRWHGRPARRAAGNGIVELERADSLIHRRGLLLERLRRRRILFGKRRVLLRDLIHLRKLTRSAGDAFGARRYSKTSRLEILLMRLQNR
jgi:hypothetical protein